MPSGQNESFAQRIGSMARNPRALTPLVLFMGFIGASLRYALETAIPAGGGFPAATLAVNIFGCFMLEIVNQYVGRCLNLPVAVVKSLGVGLIGAFTTLSAFSTESLEFLMTGRYGLFAMYFGVTVATTFAASLAGYFVANRLENARMRKVPKEGER